MRRLLATALLASLMLFLAPSDARAAAYNCSCGPTTGVGSTDASQCTFMKTIDTGDDTAATPCVTLCAETNKVMCKWEKNEGGKCPPGKVCLVNPLKTSSVPELISNILKAAVGTVGAFALLIFVYGGFLWLTSGGEAGKVQQGKDAMKWALVGLVVVFSSYALVSFVLSALTKKVG